MPLPKSVLREGGIELGPDAFATVLADNSLEPDAYKGDFLICDPAKQPKPGDLCVAIANSEAVIRVFARSDTPGGPVGKLKPINPHYEEKTLNGETDRTIGSCLWRISPIRRF